MIILNGSMTFSQIFCRRLFKFCEVLMSHKFEWSIGINSEIDGDLVGGHVIQGNLKVGDTKPRQNVPAFVHNGVSE